MSDETPRIQPSTPAPIPVAVTVAGPGIPAAEVAAGKTFALLCYILNFFGIPFFLVPVITRDNEFSLYHAKQAMAVWIIGAAGGFVLMGISVVLSFICIGYLMMPLVGLALMAFSIGMNVMGVLNVNQGLCKPLPVIGPKAEEIFKGMTKKA